jgi:hypothetical protein
MVRPGMMIITNDRTIAHVECTGCSWKRKGGAAVLGDAEEHCSITRHHVVGASTIIATHSWSVGRSASRS